jgi:holo-[acyl-carrier protein] synthase
MATREDLVGVGLDLVPIETIAKARFKHRVAEYFLSEREQSLFPHESHLIEHLASRFAAKEATIKAFPGALSPFDFEILKRGQKPVVVFKDEELESRYSVLLSITHTKDTAGAIALLTKKV